MNIEHIHLGVKAHTPTHKDKKWKKNQVNRNRFVEMKYPFQTVHTHDWHCHDESVNRTGPFIRTIQAHRIEYFLLPLSLLLLLLLLLPKTNKRFTAFFNGDEIWTRQHDTTQKRKITEPFTVYLYESVKLTFKTGIELLKNEKFQQLQHKRRY